MRYKHYVDPNKAPLFRGGERIRFMTMIVMLAVSGMLVFRARDPRMWRYFANEQETVSPKTLREFDQAHRQRRAVAAQARRTPAGSAQAAAGPDAAPRPAAALPAAPDSAATELALAEGEPAPAPQDGPERPSAGAAATTAPPVKDAGNPPQPSAASPPPAVPAAPAASGPAALAADVPPPEPAVDPQYLQKIAEPSQPQSPGSTGSAESENPAMTRSAGTGSPSEDSLNHPREIGQKSGAAPGDKTAPAPEVPAVDEDPIERKEFDYEAQAVDDKDVLRPEEMSLYWRLVRWTEELTFKQMDSRARRGLTMSHFFEHPNRYRGQLVRVQLRITRATAHETEENGNSLGIDRIYDLWGCTDESSPNPYAVAVVHLPPDFPLGHDIQEDVTFVGYFMKLMAYKSRDEKTRAAPLLIGKVVWHPVTKPVLPVNPNWVWGGVVVAMLVIVVVVRLTFQMRPLRRVTMLPPLHEGEEGIPIETWLERVEDGDHPRDPPEAINPPGTGEHPSNGNGNGHVLPGRLDRTEDQER